MEMSGEEHSSKFKGPIDGSCLVGWKNNKKASVAGVK